MVNAMQPDESPEVSSVSFLEAFVTQTDWNSQLTCETWYGHHKPVMRAATLVLLFSVLSSIIETASLSSWLITHADQVERAASTQRTCAASLCDAVQDARFSCMVDQTGESAIMLPPYNGSYAIPFPTSCIEAHNATQDLFDGFFGDFFQRLLTLDFDEDRPTKANDNNPNSIFVYMATSHMIRVRNEGEVNPPASLFEIIPFNCSITFHTVDQVFDNFPMIDVYDKEPGHIVENVLDVFVCPDAMTEDYRVVLGYFSTAHSYLLGPGLVVLAAATTTLLRLSEIVFTLWVLVGTTFLVRSCFRWPRDVRGGKAISFTSTYKVLLLLSAILNECGIQGEAGVAEFVILSLLALTSFVLYRNKEAALEWVQLGVLWYTWLSVTPYLDVGASFLRQFDGLGLFEIIINIVGGFVPGVGWWKLVWLYVFWRAFPRPTAVKAEPPHAKQE